MSIFEKEPEAKQFSVNNRVVKCSHCETDLFYRSKAQLNTAGMSFLGLDWLNKSADILICRECGQVLWFLEK